MLTTMTLAGFREVRRGPSPIGRLVSVNNVSMYLCQASYTDLSTGPPISPALKPYAVLIVASHKEVGVTPRYGMILVAIAVS